MLPHEKELVERLKDQPFALIGINSDDPQAKDVAYEERTKRDEAFRAERKYQPNGMVSVGEAEAAFIEGSRANVRKILDEQGISWRNAIDGSTSGPWASRWNVSGWPTIYVVDAKGVIRFKNVRGEAMEAAVNELLAEIEAK